MTKILRFYLLKAILKPPSTQTGKKGFIRLGYKVTVLFFFAGTAMLYSQNGLEQSSAFIDTAMETHRHRSYSGINFQAKQVQGYDVADSLSLENAVASLTKLQREEMEAFADSLVELSTNSEDNGRFSMMRLENGASIIPFLMAVIFLLAIMLFWKQGTLQNDVQQARQSVTNTADDQMADINGLESAGADEDSRERMTEARIWLDRVMYVALDKLGDPVFSLESWSAALGTSPRQFQRRLKAATGQTVTEWLHELRMQQAQKMLQEGKVQTVKQVVAAVGMRDAKYFSKRYKQRFGELPSNVLDN